MNREEEYLRWSGAISSTPTTKPERPTLTVREAVEEVLDEMEDEEVAIICHRGYDELNKIYTLFCPICSAPIEAKLRFKEDIDGHPHRYTYDLLSQLCECPTVVFRYNDYHAPF
jgi:hypothetical protein